MYFRETFPDLRFIECDHRWKSKTIIGLFNRFYCAIDTHFTSKSQLTATVVQYIHRPLRKRDIGSRVHIDKNILCQLGIIVEWVVACRRKHHYLLEHTLS